MTKNNNKELARLIEYFKKLEKPSHDEHGCIISSLANIYVNEEHELIISDKTGGYEFSLQEPFICPECGWIDGELAQFCHGNPKTIYHGLRPKPAKSQLLRSMASLIEVLRENFASIFKTDGSRLFSLEADPYHGFFELKISDGSYSTKIFNEIEFVLDANHLKSSSIEFNRDLTKIIIVDKGGT